MIGVLDGRADKISLTDTTPGDSKRKEENEGTLLVMESKRRMIDTCAQLAKLRDDYRLTLLASKFKESISLSRLLVRYNEVGATENAELLAWDLTDEFHDFFNELFEEPRQDSIINGTALDLDALSDAPLPTILMDLMMYPNAELFEAALSQLHSMFNQRTDTLHAMSGVQLLLSDEVPCVGTLSLLKSEVALVRHRIESYETWGVSNAFSGIDDAVANMVLAALTNLTEFCRCPSCKEGAVLIEENTFDLAKAAADEWGDDDDTSSPATTAVAADSNGSLVRRQRQRSRDNGDARQPTKEWQDLLRNLQVPTIMIRGVQIPYRSFYDSGFGVGPVGEEAKHRHASYANLFKVVRKTWQLVKAAVSGNKHNQNIFLQTPGFLEFMGTEMCEDPELEIAFVFVEMFRGNRDAIDDCPASIFEAFGAQLESVIVSSAHDVDPCRYLAFFETMVEVPGRGVVASAQRKTISTLVGHPQVSLGSLPRVIDSLMLSWLWPMMVSCVSARSNRSRTGPQAHAPRERRDARLGISRAAHQPAGEVLRGWQHVGHRGDAAVYHRRRNLGRADGRRHAARGLRSAGGILTPARRRVHRHGSHGPRVAALPEALGTACEACEGDADRAPR